MQVFAITSKDVDAIDRAIHALRDRIQARDSRTAAGLAEDRAVLAGLLHIFPKAIPGATWEGPQPPEAA